METGRRRRPGSESAWASERRAGERWARKRMQAPRASTRRDRVCSPREPRLMRLDAHRCGSAGCSVEAVDPPTTAHRTATQVADPLVGYDGAVGSLEGHSAQQRRRSQARSGHSLGRGPRAQTSRHAENRGCEASESPPSHRTRGARVVEMGLRLAHPEGSRLALVPSESSPPVEMGSGSWASTHVPHARSVGCHWLRMSVARPCARSAGCHLSPNAALEGWLEALCSSGVCWWIVAALEGCSRPSDS